MRTTEATRMCVVTYTIWTHPTRYSLSTIRSFQMYSNNYSEHQYIKLVAGDLLNTRVLYLRIMYCGWVYLK